MHALGAPNSLSPEDRPAALAGEKSSAQATAVRHIPDHVYDLRRGNRCSDAFYAEVESFCDELLARVERRAGVVIDGYTWHVKEFLAEAPRSRGEYAIELLTLGMAVHQYENAAQKTPNWAVELGRELYAIRRRSRRAKPVVDAIRGGIARVLISPKIGHAAAEKGSAVDRLAELVGWMEGTGEFEEEAKRLNNWRSYMATLRAEKATYWLRVACELFDQFAHDAAVALGAYTRGVQPFLRKEYTHRGWREDALFCGRSEAEYHLNMVAAEAMNRGLREQFERTEERVVLVPTCMRGAHAADCKAVERGVDIVCAGCDPDCAVNRITRRMRKLGSKVYLVPHASGFSKWLERWSAAGGETKVGVTAVACMLNIVPGGFEMRARGIPSQCVPLDYPGCRKHWDHEGIPTAVNEERLVQIVVGRE
jgi:uncharacterized protein